MAGSRKRGGGQEGARRGTRGVALTFAACFAVGLIGSLGMTLLVRSRGGAAGPTDGPGGRGTSLGTPGTQKLAPATPRPPPPPQLDGLLRAGGAALDRERFADAFREFSRAIQLAPWDARAYHGLADVYKRLDRSELAEAPLRTAIEVDPAYAPAKLFLARILRDIGGHEEAVRILESLRERAPDDPAILWELAQHEMRLGRAARAIPWLERCHAARPDYAYGMAYLGKARAEAGDLAGAQRDYEKALHLDSRLTLGWLWLGQLLVATGQRDDAEKALANYQRLNRLEGEARSCERDLLRRPDNLPVLIRLAEVRIALGRYREALVPLGRAIELDSANGDLVQLRTQIQERLSVPAGRDPR